MGERLMQERLALICRLPEQYPWSRVSNPVWQEPHSEFFAARIFSNTFATYVEYESSGVIYRVIEKKMLASYGILFSTKGDRNAG